ncbi:MAG: hypothetical protein MZV70_17420, partial [Desulfobacterales bacterium]|nr:hypothetical protein [Desulfobacterales bacterium]
LRIAKVKQTTTNGIDSTCDLVLHLGAAQLGICRFYRNPASVIAACACSPAACSISPVSIEQHVAGLNVNLF